MNTVLQDNSQSTDRLVVAIPEDLPSDEDERSLLEKGINFIPTTPNTDDFTSQKDTEKFFRRLRLKAHFTEGSSRVTTSSDAPSEVTNDNPSHRSDGFSSSPDGGSINETDQTSRPNDDIFESLKPKRSKWTPQPGQFSALDYYSDKCRREVNQLDSKRKHTRCNFTLGEQVKVASSSG